MRCPTLTFNSLCNYTGFYPLRGQYCHGALVAQSSGQAPFTSESVVSNLASDLLQYIHVKRVSQRSSQKSRVFSGYSGFLPLEILTGLLEDQDRYSDNPSIVTLGRKAAARGVFNMPSTRPRELRPSQFSSPNCK